MEAEVDAEVEDLIAKAEGNWITYGIVNSKKVMYIDADKLVGEVVKLMEQQENDEMNTNDIGQHFNPDNETCPICNGHGRYVGRRLYPDGSEARMECIRCECGYNWFFEMDEHDIITHVDK